MQNDAHCLLTGKQNFISLAVTHSSMYDFYSEVAICLFIRAPAHYHAYDNIA